MATQTKITDVGPAGMLPRGPYSPTATYTLNHVVLYDHDSWVCKALDAQGEAIEISGIAPDDPTHGAENWQALTDGGRAAYAEGETAKAKGNTAEAKAALADTAAQNADNKASLAQAAAQNADAKATLAQQKAELADTKAALADEKATLAQTAADNADQKATLANTAAQTADAKAALAQAAAENANQKASLADEKATLADQKATLADGKAQYATEQGDYAKNIADHPSYIADGTEQKPGDKDYEYHWDYATQQYVRGNYLKGDDIDYSTMTPEEKQQLIDNIKADLVFAPDADCEAAAAEIIFTPQA